MDTMNWILLTALAITLIFIVLFHIQYQKELKQKDEKVKTLASSLTSLEGKLKQTDRRKALRIKLTQDEECQFQLEKFGDHALNHLLCKRGKGLIYDVSHTGLSMICEVDLPVRKQIYLNIQFKILDEAFDLHGVMRRKNEEIDGSIQYGIKFIEMSFLDNKRLAAALQNYEIKKKKRA